MIKPADPSPPPLGASEKTPDGYLETFESLIKAALDAAPDEDFRESVRAIEKETDPRVQRTRIRALWNDLPPTSTPFRKAIGSLHRRADSPPFAPGANMVSDYGSRNGMDADQSAALKAKAYSMAKQPLPRPDNAHDAVGEDAVDAAKVVDGTVDGAVGGVAGEARTDGKLT